MSTTRPNLLSAYAMLAAAALIYDLGSPGAWRWFLLRPGGAAYHNIRSFETTFIAEGQICLD